MKKMLFLSVFLFSIAAKGNTVYICYSTDDENLKVVQDEHGYYVEYSLMGQIEASFVSTDLRSDSAELFELGLPTGGKVSVEKNGALADATLILSEHAWPIVFQCL